MKIIEQRVKELWATRGGRIALTTLALFLLVLLAPSIKWFIAAIIFATPFCLLLIGADYARDKAVRNRVNAKARTTRDGLKRALSNWGGEK